MVHLQARNGTGEYPKATEPEPSALPADAAPTTLDDLKEVREGAVSLWRLWGRLSKGSKATAGAALLALLGPLALTVYTHAEEVWQGPATVAVLAAEFEGHRAESRREHEHLRALVEGVARQVGAPTSLPRE